MPVSISKKADSIRQRLHDAFRDNLDLDDDTSRDLAFHMTDWLNDLEEVHRTYSNIEDMTGDELTDILIRFLVHVPNHLNAAAKLSGLGPVTDVFGVGIFEEPK